MARRQLEDYTPDELKELDYLDILELRADAYARHVAEMEIPDQLQKWADRMTKRYGPVVRIWKNKLPWLQALLVARYGEDPVQWPPQFSEDDVNRAEAWARGKRHNGQRGSVPSGVEYLDIDGGFARVTALAYTAAAFVMAHLVVLIGSLCALIAAIATGRPEAVIAPFLVGSAFSNYMENKVIDWMFRNRQTAAIAAMYVALYTAAPGETGGGTEVSGGSYARVNYGVGATIWEGTGGETTAADSAGTGGATQNINAITFPTPSGNWGTVTHFAVLDASSSGNFLFYGALSASKNVNNGDPAPSFPAGALDFSVA